MTLHELIATLRNLEGVGANQGERGGKDRRIVCRFDYHNFAINDVTLEGGDIVLHIQEEE